MSSVLSAIEVVLSIFVVILLGMLLTKIGWIGQKEASFISKFVIRVALPATIVSNMFGKFTSESLISMAAGLIVPVLSMLLCLGAGTLVMRALKIPPRRRGAFVIMFTFSNSVFVGLPVCRALFGEEAVAYTLIYYIANTTLFWTIGYSILQRDGSQSPEAHSYQILPAYLFARNKKDEKWLPARNALKLLQKVIPLPLVFLVISAVGVLLNVQLPDFLMSAASSVGNTVTPVSLIYIGCMLMRMIQNRNFRWEKGYLAITIGKFLLVPLLTIALIQLFSQIPAMKSVFSGAMTGSLVMEAAMPAMTQTTIVVSGCGGDDEYSAGGTALTTALSMLFIPIYMYVITALL